MRLFVNLLTLGVAVSWAALGRQRGHRASSFLTKKVLGEARCSERSFHEGKVIYVSAKLVWQLGRGAVFRAMAVTLHLVQVELGKQERSALGGRYRCLPMPDSAVCKETQVFYRCNSHFALRLCTRGTELPAGLALPAAGQAGWGPLAHRGPQEPPAGCWTDSSSGGTRVAAGSAAAPPPSARAYGSSAGGSAASRPRASHAAAHTSPRSSRPCAVAGPAQEG